MRSTPNRKTWAIIAGGGTAGHVLPGLALAGELVRRGHDPEQLHFVGAERGIEARLVPEAGYGVTLLPGRGLQRRLSVDNLAAAWGLLRALGRAIVLVRRRSPAVVVVLGGFASAACALAAVLWRVPLVVAEQNARAGAVNRLVGRFAKACAVPFEETDLPNATVTGNPVRPEILAMAGVGAEVAAGDTSRRDAARDELGLPRDRTLIAVFAGSLGARRINDATVEVVRSWARRADLAVHHVIGSRDWDDHDHHPLGDDAGPDGILYRTVRYEERMDLVLAASDLAVCRAGGTTVAELAVVGVPAILVPLPIATRDHQTANAGPLVRAGAAVLVPDGELDADRLRREAEALVGDGTDGATAPGRERLGAMAAAASALGRVDAAERVADLVESSAREESHG